MVRKPVEDGEPCNPMNRLISVSILGFLLVACSPATSQHHVDESGNQLPKKVTLSVPFTVQAPYANWDDPYQEACEEAALLIVHSYLAGNELSSENANKQLLSLFEWEQQQSYPEDITLAELAEIAETYYGYQTTIIDDPSIMDIEMQIAEGNPVIIPAAGRMLGNPYFSGEGPWYHMLVITGYDSNRFITNDPGTRRGEEYKYKKNVIMEAIHDWTGVKEEIEMGVKRVLVVEQSE